MPVTALMRRWRRTWFRPVSAFDLAMARLVVVAIWLGLEPVTRYARIGTVPDAFWQPAPPLALLGVGRPGATAATVLAWSVTALLGAAALGLFTRGALALLVPLLFLEEAWVVSAGKISHGTIPLLWVTALLACTPCNEVLALDTRRRKPGRGHPRSSPSGWFFILAYVELAAFYGGAGLSKLQESGVAWADGLTLQFHLLDQGRPAGEWLASHLLLCRLASWAVLVWELTFWLGLARPLRPVFLLGGIAFHAATTLFLGMTFWPVVALYAVFVPWHGMRRP